MSTPSSVTAPLAVNERVSVIDALRGFAIFGILLANMHYFSGYNMLSDARRALLPNASLNDAAQFFIHMLVEGKFYSLFSLLFGLGFAVLLIRAEQSGRDFGSLYRRRLGVLFAIGFAHAFLLWLGDILLLYAMVGFVLLLFRRQSNRALLTWAAVLIALPVVQYTVTLLVSGGQAQSPEAAAQSAAFMDRIVDTMAGGPASQVFLDNVGGVIFGRWPDLIFTGRIFKVLAVFLVGFYIGRTGILASAAEHRPLLRRVLAWGFVLGLPLNLGLAVLMEMDVYYALQPLGVLESVVYGIGVPALALAYAAGFTLLYLNPAVQRYLALLVPVGRTALSNYLLQTVICTLIFTAYGLGYAGTVGVVGGIALTCVIFLAQIGLSTVWVRHFRFGPAEWLWRSLTYRSWQPMRLRREAPVIAPQL